MKNKNGFYIASIIILVIILVGIIAMIIVNNKKNEEKESNNKNNENVEISSFNYDSKIKNDLLNVAREFDLKYQEYHLTTLNKYTSKIDNFNTLSNEDKLDLVGKYYEYYKDIEGYSGKLFNDNPTSVDFDNYFKNVFKTNISFENKDLLCDNYNNTNHCHVLYNKNENYYEYNSKAIEHLEDETIEYYSKLIDITKNNNIYTLTYLKVFGNQKGYYDEYNITDNSLKVASIPNDVDGYDPVKLINDNLAKVTNYDKYNKYIYQIEVDNGKIYLLSYDFK